MNHVERYIAETIEVAVPCPKCGADLPDTGAEIGHAIDEGGNDFLVLVRQR